MRFLSHKDREMGFHLKIRLISAALVLIILTSACQFTGGTGQPDPAGQQQPGSQGVTSPSAKSDIGALKTEYQSVFQPPADPFAVSTVLDDSRAAEAVMPIAGGTLSATGADGTLYSLAIPGDALLVETKIRLIPAAVSGLPFGSEVTYAAQLEPEGLAFNNFVTLTITPPQAIPVEEQLFFGYQKAGEDVIFAPPVLNSAEIKIQLLHFSGYGVTKGLLADPEKVRERLGGSAEGRLNSLASELLGRARQQAQLSDSDPELNSIAEELQPLFDQFEKEVIEPRIAAAGESCAAGQLALQTVLGFERQKQLLGMGGESLSKYAGLIATVSRVCLLEEYQLCAEDHIIHRMVPVWLGTERQIQLLGFAEHSSSAEIIQLAKDLTEKCLTFDLEFESSAVFDDGSGGGFVSNVKSKVPLHFSTTTLILSGSSALINDSFTFTVPGCAVTSVRGGSTLPIQSLVYVDDVRSPDDQLGYVRDFVLMYFPEVTTESITVKCPDQAAYVSGKLGLWMAEYLVLHQSELVTDPNSEASQAQPPAPSLKDMEEMMAAAEAGVMLPVFTMPGMAPTSGGAGGFVLQEWEVTGGEFYASKEWIKEDTSLGLTERGTFKLYHRAP
jgi:hypothetical protein